MLSTRTYYSFWKLFEIKIDQLFWLSNVEYLVKNFYLKLFIYKLSISNAWFSIINSEIDKFANIYPSTKCKKLQIKGEKY